MKTTKLQAETQFKASYPEILKSKDKPMKREAWNNYTDMLCKDGEITMKQYETWGHPRFIEPTPKKKVQAKMKTMTRKEYMKNSEGKFNEYYAQFITPATINFIKTEIGIEKLKTSKDKHLNDLYKHSNGGAGGWIWDYTPFNLELAREMGESNSQSTHTCIGKECARQLLKAEGITL